MQANPKLIALKRKFAGHDVIVPAVFAPGDALTEPQAGWINGQIATVIGNAFGGALRRAKEAGKPLEATEGWTAQEHFNELFAEYEFSGNRRGDGSGSVTRDPVQALVIFLAKEAIKAKIKAKGLKVKDFMDAKVEVGGETVSKFTLLTEEYIEKHPELEDAARAQLEAQAPDSDDDDLDLSLEEAA